MNNMNQPNVKSDRKRDLPVWAEQMRQKYLAGEASVFVLYGNVFDRYLVNGVAYAMTDFLADVLLKENKNRIMEVSLGRGVRLLQDSATSISEKEALYSYLADKGMPGIFDAIEKRMLDHPSNAVIFPYAGTIFPNGDPQFMSVEDRIAFTTLHRWSLDDALAQKDNVIILISESLTEINPAIMSNPKVAAIEVPMPVESVRETAVRHYAPKMEEQQVQLLAKQTGGLRVIQLSSIVAVEGAQGMQEEQRLAFIRELLAGQDNAEARAIKLASITAGMTPDEIAQLIDPAKNVSVNADPYAEMLEVVRKRKRELIEKECAGLIEFIEPKHDLSAVGGNEHIKTELLEIAKAIKSGDRTRSPMGLLAVGAMGAGKTFVIKAFLKEAGLSGVSLKNFRSKWVGSTEANLERVLTAVKAMGPIAVVIDEGDRSFGKQGDDADGGTSSRVIARLKEFMSDTENRGKVLFILMTNRPDKLDTDIKRPGRLDRKIPFFYADTAGERAAIVRAILQRYEVQCAIDWTQTDALFERMQGYSNADLEAVALLALEFSQRHVDQGAAEITAAILQQAFDDFMPPQETQMIAFMEMLAVFETSRRSMLPARFKAMSPQEVQQQLQILRMGI